MDSNVGISANVDKAVAGFLLPKDWYEYISFLEWNGLAGRVLEDGIFDKGDVLKFG